MESHVRRMAGRLACLAGLLGASACLPAQETEEVRSIIVEQHDSAWYARQAKAWGEVTKAEPGNENAWRNRYEATRYWVGMGTAEAKSVLAEMAQAIPGSFTYHLCAYRDDPSPDSEQGEQLVRTLPQTGVRGEDLNAVLAYLLVRGEAFAGGSRAELVGNLLHRQWEEAFYPEKILRFSYNQLQGMADGAIYFANGDTDVFCKMLLQQVSGVHRDKLVVCTSFLFFPTYREALFRALQIEPIPERGRKPTAEDQVTYPGEVAAYVAEKTGRPVYISPWNVNYAQDFRAKLYNEGLVLRYSPQPYDNVSAAKRAVEEKYRLDYLTEPAFRPQVEWQGSMGTQLNYVVMLGGLLKEYRADGNELQARRLERALRAVVEGASLSEEVRREYLNFIEQ